jgi:hypothetical protein
VIFVISRSRRFGRVITRPSSAIKKVRVITEDRRGTGPVTTEDRPGARFASGRWLPFGASTIMLRSTIAAICVRDDAWMLRDPRRGWRAVTTEGLAGAVAGEVGSGGGSVRAPGETAGKLGAFDVL